MVVSQILCLLMCCQVLACPALCVAKRTLSSAVSLVSPVSSPSCATVAISSTNVITSCHCCHDEPSNNNDSKDSQQPQRTDDCSDCFCVGSWVLVKDSANAIEFTLSTISFVSLTRSSFVPPSLDSHESKVSSRPLYGRNLLRRYCVYLL
jgi:hypothetical protein